MADLFLIDSSPECRNQAEAALSSPHQIESVATAAEALVQLTKRAPPDLILLEANLPDGDGFELIGQIRSITALAGVPIVFVTKRSEVVDRVTGFALGAEDYIVKPYEPLELRARVDARLRRSRSSSSTGESLRVGRIELNRTLFKVIATDPKTGSAQPISLTPHEFRLLAYFMSHEGHAVSREQLMRAIWGKDVHVMERTVDRHISSLRRKLDSNHERLESVHGIGYRFTVVAKADHRGSSIEPTSPHQQGTEASAQG